MSSSHRWWSWLSWWINFLTNFFKNITRRFHGKTQKNTEELLYIFPLAAFCTFLSWCQHFLSWFVSQNNHNKVHYICGYVYTRDYKGIYIIIYHYIIEFLQVTKFLSISLQKWVLLQALLWVYYNIIRQLVYFDSVISPNSSTYF